MPDPVIAAIAFDGISPFHLSVPCLVFGEEREAFGLPRFDFRVCALENGRIGTEAGLDFTTPYRLADLADAEIVIVPSWRDLDRAPPDTLTEALVQAHRRGALIVGLCLGAFPIAAAGLLDGREATTHWAFAEQFGALYPAVKLRPEVLYVDNGDVITSAGVAAGLDCCLHIMRKRYGAEAALRLARSLVLAPHRQGGQAQFIEPPVRSAPAADKLARALEKVRATLDGAHSLDSVATMSMMSRRTFTRRFQKAFGTSFGNWLTDQRVMLAQKLLETTTRSVEEIAFEAGFGTSASLRQHFATRLKTSPAQYRLAFSKR
ncbi:GlxA family transcriptional regulator [Chelativorans salis]|uniref:Helix-turn-helix domain-containing protein n=1 Tax=Chelativorans salis TaxID=2978478 RepID=A0ABT2LV67_9HYPH|nr:helix-turn-helix domain-containing protein [Chelativorans sp. EGI FJ00035]MCT7378420.1 helix-turn-helix domain-containing protein [Chelativorans sp. EGI FJ00035]